MGMTYETTRKQTEAGTWKIEKVGENASWVLKWKSKTSEMWKMCEGYASPKAAAAAVGFGYTGVREWDAEEHDLEKFSIEKWKAEVQRPRPAFVLNE